MAFRVNANVGNRTSSATGVVERLITDADRRAFRIDGDNLSRAVERFRGRRPTGAWVRSPANAGGVELYSAYADRGWRQVVTRLVPISSTVHHPTTDQAVVAIARLRNDHSTITAEFFANLENQTTNTVTTSWNSTQGIDVSQSVSYNIGLVGGETSFAYNYQWGRGGEESRSSSVSLVSGITLSLGPGESAIVRLLAEQGYARITTVYEATLTGHVVQNFNPRHEGHHFWAHSVNSVLQASGLPTSIRIVNTVDVGFYANYDIQLLDGATNRFKSLTEKIFRPLALSYDDVKEDDEKFADEKEDVQQKKASKQ
eukprot:Phypoly_transcript_09222.p1 GENE.Phypoly_transcript_09222~~Phypoly_transcript_09222.p1  ORF type:complete len:314 (+),score=29.96 Phypoly_transcript_09222:412-1353(+)